MSHLQLVWAMLWRRKARTGLTFASIAVAFLLYGMLEALGTLITGGARFGAADSLLTSHRYGFGKALPYAYRAQIEALPGVKAVIPVVMFPFRYQNERTGGQPSMATDPRTLFTADPRFLVAPEQLAALEATRTGLIAGRQMAEKYGWKIGDHISLHSTWVRGKDGNNDWEFDIVGIFDYNAELMGEDVSAMRVIMRYDYLDETRINPGDVTLYFVKVEDPAQIPAVSRAVDELFQNSAHPTKTQSEAEQQRSMLAQIGDIGLIIRAILSAVFFTLVVVAGNTMMRAFRERIAEFATLKALGFGDAKIAGLVAMESLLLCGTAGLAGLALAWLVLKPTAKAVASVLPFLSLHLDTVLIGFGLSILLGIVAAVLPAWQSARLSVVEGLRSA